MNDKGRNEYDRVHNLKYLDWFIEKVLRMFPIAPQANSRECNMTTTICGHIIEKDLIKKYFFCIMCFFRSV